MPITTNKFADATSRIAGTDALDDALRSLHVSGSLLLREAYSSPFAIAIPDAGKLASILGARANTRVVAFHLVELGYCEIQPQTGKIMTLAAGEMVVCFGGSPHRLYQGKPRQIQPIEALLLGGANMQRPTSQTLPLGASLMCGVFLLRDTGFNPLIAALPPLMRVNLSRRGELHNLSGVAHLMADEIERTTLGRGYIVERLLEILCAAAIRAYIESAAPKEAGWFRSIKDPVVGRAINAVHLNPGAAWSVQRLAREVSMSPSRFAARFAESLGDSPMAYVAKWRMNVACRKLVGSRVGIDQVAADVGYESVAAFNRAFRKHVGFSPAAWRNRETS